jgi:protoporphyrinogen IX oxidase
MGYLLCKALHIVGFVSWFAGLFYVVRLFIYHVEAAGAPEAERLVLHRQFTVMERRLWLAITVPAMVMTLVFGGALAWYYLQAVTLAQAPWLAVKLSLVVVLLGYHAVCGGIRKQLAAGTCRWTSARLRLWNELATLLLVAIVMLAVFKSLFNAVWGTTALVAFGLVLAIAVRVVRRLSGRATSARAGS